MNPHCLLFFAVWLAASGCPAEEAAFHLERSTVLTSTGDYHETWVISSEMAFPRERQDEANRVLLAKIIWNKP